METLVNVYAKLSGCFKERTKKLLPSQHLPLPVGHFPLVTHVGLAEMEGEGGRGGRRGGGREKKKGKGRNKRECVSNMILVIITPKMSRLKIVCMTVTKNSAAVTGNQIGYICILTKLTLHHDPHKQTVISEQNTAYNIIALNSLKQLHIPQLIKASLLSSTGSVYPCLGMATLLMRGRGGVASNCQHPQEGSHSRKTVCHLNKMD